MGLLYSAECPTCGHPVEIALGFGFLGVELEPYLCHDCRDVVSVVVGFRLPRSDGQELFRCEECGGKDVEPFACELTQATDEPAPKIGSQLDSGGCPKCGGALTLTGVGYWD
jgi:hypothetical protein